MENGLQFKLNKLQRFFKLEEIASQKLNQSYVDDYYLVNKLPYSFFHSKKRFVHMGVSKDSAYKEDDLLYHARTIDKIIKDTNARKVLELATGRGGNATWLSQENPDVSFTGLDSSRMQLKFAEKSASRISNYNVVWGDYHELSNFEDESFDVVFVIEALCHSNNTKKVLEEVFRALKEEGLFIVYDGYREKKDKDMSKSELSAARLLEIGVAVEHFEPYDEFVKFARQLGFSIKQEEDLSDSVIPTMQRFERQAGRFLKLGFIAKLLIFLLPNKFTYNILSGYLFPTLIREKVFSYKYTLLKKPLK